MQTNFAPRPGTLFFVSLVTCVAAFSGLAPRGLFTPKAISGVNFRPVLRKNISPMMFETKIFKKETLKFSDAPDETHEDILRVWFNSLYFIKRKL